MKKLNLFLIAAYTVTTLLSCEKETPAGNKPVQGSDVKSDNPSSLAELKPNYVYTLAGNPDKYNQEDGIGDQAGFWSLSQLIADNGYLYALDQDIIRRIKISDRTVTTLAGNPLGGDSRDGFKGQAVFSLPSSLALGRDGNIYVAEYSRVRKVTKEGMVTTIAGSTRGHQDGPAKMAKFNRLISIAVCEDGAIYVIDDQGGVDSSEFQIRKISRAGVVSTLAKGPSNKPSSFWNISSLSVLNKTLYAAGTGIFRISSQGIVTTVKESVPVFGNSLLALNDGSFFIASNNQIKKVSAAGNVSVFAGIPLTDKYARPMEGPADSVDLLTPSGFTLYNNILYIAVHPHLAQIEAPSLQQGHVIQMISVPESH